jgi:hypothetical protein
MAVADVLLISNDALRYRTQEQEAEPPLSKVVEVSKGVQLAGIQPQISEPVMRVTGFRPWNPPFAPALYGFVRYEPPGSRWDEDDAISQALFLSHFVHAHDGGFEFTARIVTNDAGELIDLKPADTAPPFTRAYCCSHVQRRWLMQGEGLQLRDLIAAYTAVRPQLRGSRVGTAVSVYAESPFVYHGRPRALLLATTLEGLVSTATERATKQFTTRVPALAVEVGLERLDRNWAKEVYGLRSTLAHGGQLLPSAEEPHRLAELEGFNRTLTDIDELLRRVLCRALMDNAFREKVDNIDTHYPVPGRGCPSCRTTAPELLVVPCPKCQREWTT